MGPPLATTASDNHNQTGSEIVNHMQHAATEIETAKRYDVRGDAQMRDRTISQLKADSELPKRTIAAMLRQAGLVR